MTLDLSPELSAALVTEPATGLRFVELSHPWGHHAPTMPGYEDVRIHRPTHHASHGTMVHVIVTVMHTGTHLNAPLHMVQGGAGVGKLPLDRFFGSAVIVGVEMEPWRLITSDDLAHAGPQIRPGHMVILNTGWHHQYSDSQHYFGRAPGLSRDAAEWLVERRVKLVGIDTPTIDHPLATSLGRHRNGPLMPPLLDWYRQETGGDPDADFPEWNPAHRTLLAAGIPTIENVGGDVDAVTDKTCTVHACPWKWAEGDACMIRLMAMLDPAGTYRLGDGRSTSPAEETSND